MLGPTSLSARPLIATFSTGDTLFNFGFHSIQAWLTEEATGDPVADRLITFTADGEVICTATTNEQGSASCDSTEAHVPALVAQGYVATFAGDGEFEAASDRAPLIRYRGEPFPG